MRSPGRAAVFFMIAVVTAGFAPSSRAQDEWTTPRPPNVASFKLDAVEFAGNASFPAQELIRVLDENDGRLRRNRPIELAAVDVGSERLRAFYFKQGFWDIAVESSTSYHEATRRARVLYTLTEGAPHRVGAILVEGNATFPAEEILGWTKIRPDDPFDLDVTALDRRVIEDTYANRGFYLVEVLADIQPQSDPGPPVVNDLVFRVSEGPRFTVGSIEIEGNEFTEDDIVRRELRIAEGDVLSRELIEDSRTSLYATGYFSRVEVAPQVTEANDGRIRVVIRLLERKMRFFGFGVGYGTSDQFRFAAEWGHRNFLGRGKRVSIRAIVASELFPIDLVRTRLETRYIEPWLFGTRTTGSVDLFVEQRREFFRDEDTQERREYDLQLVGLTLNANRRITRFSRLWLALKNEWADVDAGDDVIPPDDVRPDLTRSFTLTGERDRRNDYFEPERGFVNRAIAGFSGGILGGDNDYWKTSIESSWYRKTFGVVLAGRVRVGIEDVYGESEQIPDRDRFKLGGATTIRGYREQDIGPGDFMLLGNFEIRFPILGPVHGGVFLDGGNAWLSPEDVSFSDFALGAKDDPARAATQDVRYSTGTGLRVESPVGPVRLDYGYKLKILPVEEGVEREDRWRFHLSLGHVF